MNEQRSASADAAQALKQAIADGQIQEHEVSGVRFCSYRTQLERFESDLYMYVYICMLCVNVIFPECICMCICILVSSLNVYMYVCIHVILRTISAGTIKKLSSEKKLVQDSCFDLLTCLRAVERNSTSDSKRFGFRLRLLRKT